MALLKNLRVKTDIDRVIKYQILTYAFFNDVELTKTDISLLAELAKAGQVELTDFCKHLEDKEFYKSAQSARNAISKCEKKELISKVGSGKKSISISEALEIVISEAVVLNFNIIGIETKAS